MTLKPIRSTPLQQQRTRKGPTVTSIDLQQAQQLLDCLRSKGKAIRGVSLKSWAASIARLRRTVGSGKLETVLNWYCKSIGKPRVPFVASCAGFRRRWDDLELACQIQGGDQAPDNPLIRELLQVWNWIWPSTIDSKTALDCALLSAHRYQKFINLLSAYHHKHKPVQSKVGQIKRVTTQELWPVVDYVLASLPPVVEQVKQWMQDLHSFLWRQSPDEVESLVGRAWNPEHPLFVRQMRDLCARRTGDRNTWFAIWRGVSSEG